MTASSKKRKHKKKKQQTSMSFSSPLVTAHNKNTTTNQQEEEEENMDKVKRRGKETKKKSEMSSDEEKLVTKKNKSTRSDRRKQKRKKEEDEEKQLTSMIFGNDEIDNNNDDDDDDEYFSTLSNKGKNKSTSFTKDGMEDTDGALFEIDRSGVDEDEEDYHKNNNSDDDDDDDNNAYDFLASNQNDEDEDVSNHKKAVWEEEEEDGTTTIAVSLASKNKLKKLQTSMSDDVIDTKELEERLRQRFQSTVGSMTQTDWATAHETTTQQITHQKEQDSSSDEEEDYPTSAKLLSSATPLLSSKSSQLPSNIIKLIRLPDANLSDPNNSTVQSVQFHSASDEDAPLLLTAGMDKALRFFRVNEEASEKIHGVFFPKFPIHKASFLGDTGNVVVTSRRPFFYLYDAEAGKIDLVPKIQGREDKSLEKFTTSPDGTLIAFIGNDGFIILVEARTKMWVADLKINGSVRALAFTPDGEFIIASGSDGEVYRWDIRSKKCVDRFMNEDGTITSALAVSKRFLAVGAESGVVNLYNDNHPSRLVIPRMDMRKPIKSIMNLQTSIDQMTYNHDGQILAMSSKRMKNSLKLLHVPSQTIFSNWPTSKTPLQYVYSLDFSPSSKFMAIGNDKGNCLLYKVAHYNN